MLDVRRFAAAVSLVTIAAASILLDSMPAGACDICAVYTTTELRETRVGFSLGAAEQFTRFATLQEDGHEVANPAHQRLDSSITQVFLGYAFTPRLSSQLNVPVIARSFRRPEGATIDRGSESGFGDVSLVGQATVWDSMTDQSLIRLSLLGGVKFPTGSSDRLREELEEGHDEEGNLDAEHDHTEAPLGRAVHAHSVASQEESGVVSGIHGHDLALGSGSWDGIVGGKAFGTWHRLFLTAGLQYAIRTRGDFGYRYADDLTWSGGPGWFAWLDHEGALGIQGVLSGETKGKDDLRGEAADDTAMTALYAGPAITFAWRSSLAAEIGADLPVLQHNSALQIVPDYRIRGGVSWRF